MDAVTIAVQIDGKTLAQSVVMPDSAVPDKAEALATYEAALLESRRLAGEAWEARKAANDAEERSSDAQRALNIAERRFRCAVVGEPWL